MMGIKAKESARWYISKHSSTGYEVRRSWDCGEHEHDTEESANACIQKKEDEKERYYLSLNCKPFKKTFKKIVVIEREYWLCGHPEHRHISECIAKKCIIEGKNKESIRNQKISKKEISAMFISVLSGQTLKAAGSDLGVNSNRVRYILHKTKRIIGHPRYKVAGEDKSVLVGIGTITDIRNSSDAMEFYIQRLRLWEQQS
jgi:hypothetical protein